MIYLIITKGSQGIPEYMFNQVTNTTESFNRKFKHIFIVKIANVLYETIRVGLDVNNRSLKQGDL